MLDYITAKRSSSLHTFRWYAREAAGPHTAYMPMYVFVLGTAYYYSYTFASVKTLKLLLLLLLLRCLFQM